MDINLAQGPGAEGGLTEKHAKGDDDPDVDLRGVLLAEGVDLRGGASVGDRVAEGLRRGVQWARGEPLAPTTRGGRRGGDPDEVNAWVSVQGVEAGYGQGGRAPEPDTEGWGGHFVES